MLSFFDEIKDDLTYVEGGLKEVVTGFPPVLRDAAAHLFAAGGKRLRPAFALLGGHFGHYALERVTPLAVALELIHMATLVHDDVVDGAFVRRGRPTVQALWGNRVAIWTGDALFAKAIEIVAGYEEPLVSKKLAATCMEVCAGEFAQARACFNPRQTLRGYFGRIRSKTAVLIAGACELGAVVCGAPRIVSRALGQYGLAVGMAFQVVDDVLDIIANEKILGKAIGSDIREGIATLPVLYVLCQSKRYHRRLREILCAREKSEAEIGEAIAIVKEEGGIAYSLEVARRYVGKSLNALQALPEIPSRQKLEAIAQFVVAREF
uniref:Heptaprenyl diphosphate synthase n=1 Tax=Ammonifex degensii TaxID=42838 RepID=A0A7C2I143_9THEO